jgi:hypothetical protein
MTTTTMTAGLPLLLKHRQLAARLGVSTEQLDRLLLAGVVPGPLPRRGPGTAWWSWPMVEEFLRRPPAGSPEG